MEIDTWGVRMAKSRHNVEKLRRMCLGVLIALKIYLSKKKQLLVRENSTNIGLYVSTYRFEYSNNDMSIIIILISTGY